MIRFTSFFDMLFWNIIIVGLWHICVFIACVKLPNSTFDASKQCYQAKTWERDGRWYKEKLKIQLWKDKVPQYIGKEGFSKEHLTDVSIEYLDAFILETCRAEWTHKKDCVCTIIVLLINPLFAALCFSFLILLSNLPFAIIQRYNRFRLQSLRKRIQRELATSGVTITA